MEGKFVLQFLILTCFWWNSMPRPSFDDEFQSLLRTVVDDQEAVAPLENYHISGTNGYCIDVKDGKYTDGNPIIVWSCTTNYVNQIWTFDSNGTLQSNGKCLTTSGYTHGSNLVIFDCDTADKDATIWKLKSGVIVNPKSGLVITALSGKVGTKLTAETNRYASIQTWRVDNITQPKSYSIVGFKGLCLYGSDDFVWLATCNSSDARQKWVLYRDGTIRPSHNKNWCVSYDIVSSRVVVVACGLGLTSERWLFTGNGYIWNQRVNKVMDVKQSNPSSKQIIVYPATGNPNQKWTLKLIS